MALAEASSSIYRPDEYIATETPYPKEDGRINEEHFPNGTHIFTLTYPPRYDPVVERPLYTTEEVKFVPFDISSTGNNEIIVSSPYSEPFQQRLDFKGQDGKNPPMLGLSVIDLETQTQLFRSIYGANIKGVFHLGTELSPRLGSPLDFPKQLPKEKVEAICEVVNNIRVNDRKRLDLFGLRKITQAFISLGMPPPVLPPPQPQLAMQF